MNVPDRLPAPLSRRTFVRRGLASGLASGLACGLVGGLALPSSAAAQSSGPIRLRDLYNKDLTFSPLALQLKENRVAVNGFMAPPLRAQSRFFVLTRRPMAVCPFCDSEADWSDDIVAVYTKRIVKVVSFNLPIRVSGLLELGSYRDPDTGFVSRVRLVDASYARA